MPPVTVVPLAENSGLIADIGRWVLERPARTANAGPKTLVMTTSALPSTYPPINSWLRFRGVGGRHMGRTKTPAHLLTLEITEGVFVQDAQRALIVLDDLKRLGVRLALDDFGTGFSSLSYLKRFPVDIVKIDQSFVADLSRDHASHAIVSTVIDLAHGFNGRYYRRGRDGRAAQRSLQLGSESCQGFYFARPMSADTLDLLTREDSSQGELRLPLASLPT